MYSGHNIHVILTFTLSGGYLSREALSKIYMVPLCCKFSLVMHQKELSYLKYG